jgi:hypothetical protein
MSENIRAFTPTGGTFVRQASLFDWTFAGGLMAAALIAVAPAPALAAPHIDFVQTEQHIGKMEQHTSRECTFRFVNTGDAPLIVEKTEAA